MRTRYFPETVARLVTATAADVAAIPDQSDRSIVNHRITPDHTEGQEAAMSKAEQRMSEFWPGDRAAIRSMTHTS